MPVLMLTARAEDVDQIIGLELGADDYLTKPFNPRELVARVKASCAARRREAARRSKELTYGELMIDAGKREVRRRHEIQLAPKEFDLLWQLLDHRGASHPRAASRSGLGLRLRRRPRTVDAHVRQIEKLGDASWILTVWGVGYKFASERTSAPPA